MSAVGGSNPSFKERRPFSLRAQDVINIRKIHPTKVPVVVERYAGERQLPMLTRSKFLVPEQISVAELAQIIRRRLQLHPDQALFLLVNEKSLISNSLTLAQVYALFRRRLQLHPDQALFLLVNEKSLISNSLTLAQVYADEKDVDGYLYIVYSSHQAFG